MREYDDIEKRVKQIMIAGVSISPFFDQLVKEGRIIFIFDGFNEISLGVVGSREDLKIHFKKAWTIFVNTGDFFLLIQHLKLL